MYKLTLISLILFCYHDILAQSEIEIEDNFKVNRTYNFESSRWKSDTDLPSLEKVKTITPIYLTISKGKRKTRKFSWKYGRTTLIGIEEKLIDSKTNKSINIYENIKVVFTVDKATQIIEVDNYNDCKRQIENSMFSISSDFQKGIAQSEKDKIMTAIRSTFDSQEKMILTYFPEISLYLSLYGTKINADSVYSEKLEFPNPFNGRNFPALSLTKIKEINANSVIIENEQVLDKTELNSIWKETTEKLTSKKEDHIPIFDLVTNTIIYYNIDTGFVSKVSNKKTITTSDKVRIEYLEIVLRD